MHTCKPPTMDRQSLHSQCRSSRRRCHSVPLIWLVTLSALSLTHASIASQPMPPTLPAPGRPQLRTDPSAPGGDGEASEWSDDNGDDPDELLVSSESRLESHVAMDAGRSDQDQDAVASQPLQTLKKLQQMLDETDYMTTKSTRSDDSPYSRPAQIHNEHQFPGVPALARPDMNSMNNMNSMNRGRDNSFTPIQQPQSLDSDMPPDLPPQYLYDQNQEDPMPQEKQSHQYETEPGIPPAHPYDHQRVQQQPDAPSVAEGEVTPQNQPPKQERHAASPLWTSKDRSKYKKMQQMQRRADEERRRLEQHLLQQPGSSSDDEQDGLTDTDDGLGYTLPNLPVYMSDAEGESSDSGEQLQPVASAHQASHRTNAAAYDNHQRTDMFHKQQQVQQQYTYANGQQQFTPPPPNIHQTPPVIDFGSGYQPYIPYYNPQQQQQQQQRQQQPFSNLHQQQQYSNPQLLQTFPNPQQQQQMMAAQYTAAWGYPPQRLQPLPNPSQIANTAAVAATEEHQLVMSDVPTTLAEATSRINFDSIQKISLLFVGVATLSYCAVSPRNLQPLSEYNRHFYDNLRLVALCTIAPLANFLLVCDARENDINSVITSFYTSFTVGYALAFILEILLTTGVRLGVFAIWEPNIFKLSPKVPTLVLPWVLRENKYRPKRITLFAADFLSSCVASPIIEEYVKLKILQLSVPLPRNFQWCTKAVATSNRKKRRKRRVAEAAPKNLNEDEVTNINSYVTHMLAVSLGMKLCDSSRRILMYTKAGHSNKSFYAFVRGLFPIQELCGTMTALALAKRDVLGVNMAQWQMLLPAVFIHGMANLRGMKPLFKWNSATPWSEMQLSPLSTADDSTVSQLINKGFAKLMWLVLLGRVLGYCIKNYYLISRQARKRTTTYAGKQAAFSAELAAAEMLKKTKDKK